MSKYYSFETDISIPGNIFTNQSSYAMNKFLTMYNNKLNITKISSGGCMKDTMNDTYIPLYVNCSKKGE